MRLLSKGINAHHQSVKDRLTLMAAVISSLSVKLARTVLTLPKPDLSNTVFPRFFSNAMADIVKPRETAMKKKLTESFKPAVLEIVNESFMHNVPKGSETHFKVLIVSDAFEGVSLVQRHRQVNSVLEEEFASGLHALSIVAKTLSQWEKSSQQLSPSPPCRGGAGL